MHCFWYWFSIARPINTSGSSSSSLVPIKTFTDLLLLHQCLLKSRHTFEKSATHPLLLWPAKEGKLQAKKTNERNYLVGNYYFQRIGPWPILSQSRDVRLRVCPFSCDFVFVEELVWSPSYYTSGGHLITRVEP